MRRGRPGVMTFTLLAAVLAVGCGGDSGDSTVTVTEETAASEERQPPVREKEPKPKPEPLSLAEQAEGVVEQYYAAVDSSLYDEAWKLLSPTLQAEQGGFAAWKAGYSTTLETKAAGVRAIDATEQGATVELQIDAVDSDACGSVNQTFAGTWTLGMVGDEYLGTAFNVQKTGGGTPSTDPTVCASGSGAPVAPAGCDPNYTGCVPPYPPDVDCLDLQEEVEVIGEDVHNLDLGGDEEACEIFFK